MTRIRSGKNVRTKGELVQGPKGRGKLNLDRQPTLDSGKPRNYSVEDYGSKTSISKRKDNIDRQTASQKTKDFKRLRTTATSGKGKPRTYQARGTGGSTPRGTDPNTKGLKIGKPVSKTKITTAKGRSSVKTKVKDQLGRQRSYTISPGQYEKGTSAISKPVPNQPPSRLAKPQPKPLTDFQRMQKEKKLKTKERAAKNAARIRAQKGRKPSSKQAPGVSKSINADKQREAKGMKALRNRQTKGKGPNPNLRPISERNPSKLDGLLKSVRESDASAFARGASGKGTW